MIAMIVGRCHVGESHPEVLRYVISRLKQKKKTWRALPRDKRRELLRTITKEHNANREVYAQVMWHRSWS